MPKPAPPPPVLDPNDPLAVYWNQKVERLAYVSAGRISAEEAERHRIYSLLTMALIYQSWNGNKKGIDGDYPFRAKQCLGSGRYQGDRYLGHNIVSIAVDDKGYVIDFEFNHNEIFNSSAEHAEARLIRRVFSLTQINNGWAVLAPDDKKESRYGNTFSAVTIYTSLESCAQCSGVMALANVDRVIYLQSDPGQFLIGNMLYNLTGRPARKYGAPLPISASAFGFEYKAELDEAYVRFYRTIEGDPNAYFYRATPQSTPDRSLSITSFLCTDEAYDIFWRAEAELANDVLLFPSYRSPKSDGRTDDVKTNADVLAHARRFLKYTSQHGNRATPHR